MSNIQRKHFLSPKAYNGSFISTDLRLLSQSIYSQSKEALCQSCILSICNWTELLSCYLKYQNILLQVVPIVTGLEMPILVKGVELRVEKEMGSSLPLCKGQMERLCVLHLRNAKVHGQRWAFWILWEESSDIKENKRYIYVGSRRGINPLHKCLFLFKRISFNFLLELKLQDLHSNHKPSKIPLYSWSDRYSLTFYAVQNFYQKSQRLPTMENCSVSY